MTDASYVDTSSFVQVLVPDRNSERVRAAVRAEKAVIVSSLTQLEAATYLLGLRRGGAVTYREFRALSRELDLRVVSEPFRLQDLPGAVFDDAIGQLKVRGAVHCRAVDRLHLAAMQILGISRLITSDRQQARAARSLDFEVVEP